MKNNEFILLLLLVGHLATISCSGTREQPIEEQKPTTKEDVFSFKIGKLPKEVILGTPVEVEYSYEEPNVQKRNYQVKFEFEEDKNSSATLNGHKPGEWFNISRLSGKLSYIPLTSGTHKVKIVSKSDAGGEKSVSFTIVSNTEHSNPVVTWSSFDKFDISGDRFIDNGVVWKQSGHSVSSILINFKVLPYSHKPILKGRFRMPDLGIDENINCSPPTQPNGLSDCVCKIHYHYIPDSLYIKDEQEFRYEVVFENAEGDKSTLMEAKIKQKRLQK